MQLIHVTASLGGLFAAAMLLYSLFRLEKTKHSFTKGKTNIENQEICTYIKGATDKFVIWWVVTLSFGAGLVLLAMVNCTK